MRSQSSLAIISLCHSCSKFLHEIPGQADAVIQLGKAVVVFRRWQLPASQQVELIRQVNKGAAVLFPLLPLIGLHLLHHPGGTFLIKGL